MKLDLSSFEKTLASLDEVLALPLTPIIRDSTIQRFEYTFELSHKMLKRYLEMTAPTPSEVDQMEFRDLIRVGAEKGLIRKPETWFVYRQARNETSHGYDEAKAKLVYAQIKPFAAEARFLFDQLTSKRSRI